VRRPSEHQAEGYDRRVRTSVVLATCDSARHLGDLLDSLRRQTQPPFELVVEDDASTDETRELLSRFAQEAGFPVRCELHDTRRGHVEAFLRGAARATGDAVAFCDHDDVWEPHKLAACGAELDRTGAMLVLHTTRLVDEDLRDLGTQWPPVGPARLVPPLGLVGIDIDTPGLTMVFRRELLTAFDSESRPLSRYMRDEQMLHDEWVSFTGGVLGSIAVLPEPLVRYRQHGSNQSGWVRRERDTALRPALDHYEFAAEYLEGCARYLETAAAGGPDRARIEAGAAAYRHAAGSWALRAELYRTKGRGRRMRLLARLVAGHAYGARAGGGFGRASLAKDVTAGIALHVSADDR
jgi:glycosyltransferase involved in cell wall biosynthesis